MKRFLTITLSFIISVSSFSVCIADNSYSKTFHSILISHLSELTVDDWLSEKHRNNFAALAFWDVLVVAADAENTKLQEIADVRNAALSPSGKGAYIYAPSNKEISVLFQANTYFALVTYNFETWSLTYYRSPDNSVNWDGMSKGYKMNKDDVENASLEFWASNGYYDIKNAKFR